MTAPLSRRFAAHAEEMAEALGYRSCGPFLLVPALMEISPLGTIAGVPTLFAVIVLLFAVQMAAGARDKLLHQVFSRNDAADARNGSDAAYV